MSTSKCADKFNISIPQFETLTYWYHLYRDKNSQFQKLLNLINEDEFKKDCYEISSRELRKKYQISNHHLIRLKQYYHIFLSKDDSIRLAKQALEKLTPEQKEMSVIKCQQSKIKHYGSLEECNKQTVLKMKETCLNRYGVDNAAKLEETQKKKCITNLERYGTPISSQCEQVKEKSKQTRIKNFGSLEESYKHGALVHSQNCMEREGVSSYLLTQRCRQSRRHYSKSSTINQKFENFLKINGITNIETEYYIPSYFYDFKIDNILIEINPYFTHCSTKLYDTHYPVDKYYHQNKTIAAQKKGFYCFHVFDWISWETVIKFIKNNNYLLYDYFEEPRQHIYNFKTKMEQTEITDNCVIIYDDGGMYIDK